MFSLKVKKRLGSLYVIQVNVVESRWLYWYFAKYIGGFLLEKKIKTLYTSSKYIWRVDDHIDNDHNIYDLHFSK